MSPGKHDCRTARTIFGMRSQLSIAAHRHPCSLTCVICGQRSLRAGQPLQSGPRLRPRRPHPARPGGCARARRPPRHGPSGLEALRRQLSRPGHQTSHPGGGAGSKRRIVRAIDRPPEEGRHGQGAERLLDGSGWLPEPLRLVESSVSSLEQESEAGPLPEFLGDDKDRENANEDEDPQQLDAAE